MTEDYSPTLVNVGDIWTYDTYLGGGSLKERHSYLIIRVYRGHNGWGRQKGLRDSWCYDMLRFSDGNMSYGYSLMSGECLSTVDYWILEA